MKRKTLVRILAATLSLSMAFGLSACGSQDAQQSSSNNSEPPAATGTTPAEETGATEIVMNLDGEPSSLSPFLMGGGKSGNMMYNACYGSLWRVEYDDSLSADHCPFA